MKKKSLTDALFLLLLLLTGCVAKDDESIPTYTVIQQDFIDTVTIEGTVEPLKTIILFCPNNISGAVIYIAKNGVHVKEGEVVCIIEDSDLENEYESALIKLETALADLNKTKAELDMQFALLEADVNNNKIAAEIANLDSLQLKYSSKSLRRIRELELQITFLEKKKIEQKLKMLKLIQQSEIRKQEMVIKRHNNTINDLKARIETLTIKSPKSALVTRAIHWMTGNKIIEGDPAWEGLPLIVIPDMQEMKVIMNATEADYKRINLQNLVTYSFDAMPTNRAWGKILKKAPIGKAIGKSSKVKFFEIEASVDSVVNSLTPGLSSKCRITITQVVDTFTIPQIAVFEEDSMKVVYVKKNKFYEVRQIITGVSSLKTTVVIAGLVEKERIALLKPSKALIKEKTLLPDSILRAHSFKRSKL